jgi:hypothetical protein
LLHKSEALRILKEHSLSSTANLCIRRRYVPSGEIPEARLVLRDVCLDVLKQASIP